MVATGLGSKDDEGSVKLVASANTTKADGSTDYQKLDRPTVLRQQNGGDSKQAVGSDMDYLDIPAFFDKISTTVAGNFQSENL